MKFLTLLLVSLLSEGSASLQYDIEFLGCFESLKQLRCKATMTMDGLLVNCRRRNLRDNDLALLTRCSRGMLALDLSGNRITSIKHLQKHGILERLTSLNLERNQITNFQLFESLPSLLALKLGNNRIVSMDFGSHLQNFAPHIESINLESNQIQKLEVLQPVASTLKELSLSHNQITSFHGLGMFQELETLSLDNNRIASIELDSGMENMMHLDLAGNLLQSIQGIDAFSGLTYLSVAENPILEVNHLRSMKKIRSLDLTGTIIKSLDGIQPLLRTKLKNIKLGNTQFEGYQDSSARTSPISLGQHFLSSKQSKKPEESKNN